MQCNRIILLILILTTYCNVYIAEETDRIPFLKQLSKEAISGIIKANYRETPIDEIFSINQIPFAKIRLPHKYEHPCLLFKQNTQDRIKMRRNREPYLSWADQIINAAFDHSGDPSSTLMAELPRSKIAKLNAFAWFLSSNDEFLRSAKAAMMNISDTSPPITAEGGKYGHGWGDWMQSAEALQNYAVAYDILFHKFSGTEKNLIKQKLADQTDQLYNYFSHFPEDFSSTQLSIGAGISKNNHIIDIASGVATVSMVLDHPKSEVWFDNSISQLQIGLAQIAGDGSYREGAYYGRFVASRLFPLFIYINNRTGENLFKHPRINKFIRWLIAMEKPDGSVPDFDDAFPDNLLFQPLSVGLSPLGNELRYLFDKNQNRYNNSDPAWVEAFCAFDDRVLPRKPDFETTFTFGGYEIFRGNNQTFGLLLAEPGRPYISNHDHIEPTNFTLSAFNKDLLIDSGYGPGGVNNKDRNWFTSGRAHNIPLVNGLSLNQNPVWGDNLGGKLENIFHSQSLSSAQVSAYYQDTEITRKILFCGSEYFVVIDNLESDYQNRYSIPWHGLGDFSRRSNNKVEWQQEEVNLTAEFISLDTFNINTRQGLHTLDTSDLLHTTASIDFNIENNAELISVFIPDKNNTKHISNIAIKTEGNSNARKLTSINNSRTDYIIIAQNSWKYEEFSSDADIAYITQDNSYTVSLEEATYFSIDQEPIFISDKPIDIILDCNTSRGYIDVNNHAAVSMKLFQNYDPGLLTIDDKLTEYHWNGESISFSIDQSGAIRTGNIYDKESISISNKNDLPMLVKLSSSLDSKKEFENLNYYEKTQLRNEVIDYCGTSIISLIDSTSTIPGFTSKIYGISAGLIRSMWNATGNFKFNLPQSFRFKRKIGDRTYDLYDEGYITNKGLHIKSLRFNIDNKYYLSHDRDFSDQKFSSLLMRFNKYSASAYWESFHAKNSYLIELQRRSDIGYIQTSYSQNEFLQQTSNSFSFQKQNYAGDLAVNNTDDNYDFFLTGRRNGKLLCTALQSNFDKKNQTYSGSLYNSVTLSDNIKFSNHLSLPEPSDDLEKLNSYTSLVHHFNNISGAISISNNTREAGMVRARESVKFGKWRSSTLYSKDTVKEISAAYCSIDFSAETKLENENYLYQNFLFHPLLFISTKVEVGWDISEDFCSSASLGLFTNSKNRIGSEFCMLRTAEKNLLGVAGIIDAVISKNEVIDIYTSVFWMEDGDIDRYEIIITQSGNNISPGIYISRQENGFSRCEGYLIWKF